MAIQRVQMTPIQQMPSAEPAQTVRRAARCADRLVAEQAERSESVCDKLINQIADFFKWCLRTLCCCGKQQERLAAQPEVRPPAARTPEVRGLRSAWSVLSDTPLNEEERAAIPDTLDGVEPTLDAEHRFMRAMMTGLIDPETYLVRAVGTERYGSLPAFNVTEAHMPKDPSGRATTSGRIEIPLEEMTHPVMRGVDLFLRHLVIVKIRKRSEPQHVLKVLCYQEETPFQSTSRKQWKFSEGFEVFPSSAYDAREVTNHTDMTAERLRILAQLIRNEHPTYELAP